MPKPFTRDSVRLPQGTLLFAEGDPGTTAFVIKQGRIEIFLPLRDGDLSLVVRGPGEIVGEMALIDRGCRSASARALDDCDLSVITDEQFARRLGNSDPVLRMCLAVVIDRYRQTVSMFDKVAISRPDDKPLMVTAVPNQHLAAALQTLSTESELRRALANDEFELYFQPIVRLPERRLSGFEALLRWNHPDRGLVSPGAFIPLAEASGMIVDITAWCITQVGRLFPRLQAAGLENVEAVEALFLSVNISGHDLTDAAFMGQLVAMLDETGVAADAIKLEVTESVLMNEPLKAAAVLKECRARGVMIAIDDFGTGYSSLSHLSTLPITTIKIDQSFVRSMVADPTSRKIIHMILRLASELEIPVVAEGIEGEPEAAELSKLGCALGQGYLFGRPQPFGPTLQAIRTWTVQAPAQPVAARAEIGAGPIPLTTAA